ncbi:MAG: DUF1385 domain-containing protein, partial [Lachnospiraceae bacterium]|nr:DUF1385 domain-containing protein [Lachnospiraceae bacterium]
HGVIANRTIYKIPVVRGVLSFIDSLVLGLSTLNFSSDIYMSGGEINEAGPEKPEKEKPEKEESSQAGDTVLSVVITIVSLILAMGLFMVLPYFASLLFRPLTGEGIALSLIEGLIRILIFIGYIRLISLMEDIRRVFMYHGAEHKCINCLEAGLPLSVENVRRSSREHRRCGTSFLLYVMVISIVFFAFIQTDTRWLKIVMRIVLIPVIAGVSYEFIRLAGKSDNPVVGLLSKPGLWLQKLTTREPDDEMIEVGIRSVEAIFDWRGFLRENFGEKTADDVQ